jgi:hypothetical protein
MISNSNILFKLLFEFELENSSFESTPTNYQLLEWGHGLRRNCCDMKLMQDQEPSRIVGISSEVSIRTTKLISNQLGSLLYI